MGVALASDAVDGAPGRADRAGPAEVALRAARRASSCGARCDERGGGARFRRRPRASPARARLDLSPAGDLDEAAANLFAYLRALDATGAPDHRRRADPRTRSRRGDQRPPAPRRRAARRRAVDAGLARPIVAAAAETLRFFAYSTCALACARRMSAPSRNRRTDALDMNSALDWDEFRLVKAIADARSLVGAARGARSEPLDDLPSPRRHRERDRRAPVRAFARRLSADRGGRGNDRAGDRRWPIRSSSSSAASPDAT